MDTTIVIRYTNHNEDAAVEGSILAILYNTLPYMVDNVHIEKEN